MVIIDRFYGDDDYDDGYKDEYDRFYNAPFDENNPYELYLRSLISSEDFANWLENDKLEAERKRAIKLKRKRIFDILFNN